MPTPTTLLFFALVVAAFAAFPGPSNLYVLTRGIGAGATHALAGALGCATGAMTYVVATVLGLSALLASSRTAFAVLHYLGAAYLLYLGVRALRSRDPVELRASSRPSRLWLSYRQGLFVELSNPKVALFFLAFFPQFVHTASGPAWLQILILGCVFVAIGLVSDSLYALGSGAVGSWLRRRPTFLRRQNHASGALYLALGAWAALSGGEGRR